MMKRRLGTLAQQQQIICMQTFFKFVSHYETSKSANIEAKQCTSSPKKEEKMTSHDKKGSNNSVVFLYLLRLKICNKICTYLKIF